MELCRLCAASWRVVAHAPGPVQIVGHLAMAALTVLVVLARCRINRLSCIDRVTGGPVRRYEHGYPGLLMRVDVTKFASISDSEPPRV